MDKPTKTKKRHTKFDVPLKRTLGFLIALGFAIGIIHLLKLEEDKDAFILIKQLLRRFFA